MANQKSRKALWAALLTTVAVAVIAVAVVVAASVSGSRAGGIGAYSGGISSRFVGLLALALPVIFALAFLIFRRPQG